MRRAPRQTSPEILLRLLQSTLIPVCVLELISWTSFWTIVHIVHDFEMLSPIMRSLLLLSLLHQMIVTAELYKITCMPSVMVHCGETAIVKCNHTGQLKLVMIGWTNATKRNCTLHIINETTQSEDGQVSVEVTHSNVKLKIHNVLVSDVLNVGASAENGHEFPKINLGVEGVCESKDNGNGMDSLNNKTFDNDDFKTEQTFAQKPERSKFVAVSVVGVLAVLLVILAILVCKKRRWKSPIFRGRLFSQISLLRGTEEELNLEDPPADTTLNSTTGDT